MIRISAILILLLSACALTSIDHPEPIDKNNIRSTIKDSVTKSIFPCYDKLVTAESAKTKNHSALEGKIVISFEVDPNGKSKNFKVVKSTIKSPDVANCVQQAIEQSQFQAPPAGQEAVITYPFVFSSKN